MSDLRAFSPFTVTTIFLSLTASFLITNLPQAQALTRMYKDSNRSRPPVRTSVLTLLLIVAAITLAGCSRARDKARLDLAQLNIGYTDTAFIDNAREGNRDVVKLFLDAGMDIETKTTGGQTALMTAALTNKIDVVKLLIEHGADVNAKNKYNGTALMSAAWKGHTEIAQLLIAAGADLSLKDNRGMDALMFAAWENHLEIVKALLDKKGEVDTRDVDG